MRAKGDIINIIVRLFIFAVLISALAFSYMYSTKGYETRGKGLIITTHNEIRKFNYLQIMDVRKVAAGEMAGLSRTFGVGGLFGYSGHFHNSTIGDMTFYATQQKNWVLMHTFAGEAIVVTPDNPDKFVYEVTAIITPNN